MTLLSTPDADVLDSILRRRRSVRDFDPSPLTDTLVLRLMWAAQGITGSDGRRTTPSPKRTFGLRAVAVTAAGVLEYEPEPNGTRLLAADDRRADLQAAAGGQEAIASAPVTIVLAGSAERISSIVDPARAYRYLVLEAGHAGQNLLLEAVALGLAAVPMGSFDDAAVQRVVSLAPDWAPFELVSVGRPRS